MKKQPHFVECQARTERDNPAMATSADDQLIEMGRRLKAARVATGLNQKDFKQWQIEETRLSMWENGKRPINAVALLPFCDRFAISLDWLLRGNPALMPTELYDRIADILSSDGQLPRGQKPGRKPLSEG